MTVAQLEYADQYSDPLPTQDTISKLIDLGREYECLVERVERKQTCINAVNKPWLAITPASQMRIENELTHLELRLADCKRELVNVARLIVAEDAAMEVTQ